MIIPHVNKSSDKIFCKISIVKSSFRVMLIIRKLDRLSARKKLKGNNS